jgi:hypothetical protein
MINLRVATLVANLQRRKAPAIAVPLSEAHAGEKCMGGEHRNPLLFPWPFQFQHDLHLPGARHVPAEMPHDLGKGVIGSIELLKQIHD